MLHHLVTRIRTMALAGRTTTDIDELLRRAVREKAGDELIDTLLDRRLELKEKTRAE
jgi:hypothetical protein